MMYHWIIEPTHPNGHIKTTSARLNIYGKAFVRIVILYLYSVEEDSQHIEVGLKNAVIQNTF